MLPLLRTLRIGPLSRGRAAVSQHPLLGLGAAMHEGHLEIRVTWGLQGRKADPGVL